MVHLPAHHLPCFSCSETLVTDTAVSSLTPYQPHTFPSLSSLLIVVDLPDSLYSLNYLFMNLTHPSGQTQISAPLPAATRPSFLSDYGSSGPAHSFGLKTTNLEGMHSFPTQLYCINTEERGFRLIPLFVPYKI